MAARAAWGKGEGRMKKEAARRGPEAIPDIVQELKGAPQEGKGEQLPP